MIRSGEHDWLSRFRSDWPPGSVLASMSDSVLTGWIRAGTVRRFSRGQALIVENQQDRNAFLLLSGCVKVITKDAEGGESLLAVRAGGDIVGEMAAIDGHPRSATVLASGRTAVVACEVPVGVFVGLLTRHPDAFATLSAAITSKFRAATRRRSDRKTVSSVQLARVLVELIEQYGQQVAPNAHLLGIDLTQAEFGALIGVSETTAFRAVQQWRRARWVDTHGRRMVVRDLAGLRAFAGVVAEP